MPAPNVAPVVRTASQLAGRIASLHAAGRAFRDMGSGLSVDIGQLFVRHDFDAKSPLANPAAVSAVVAELGLTGPEYLEPLLKSMVELQAIDLSTPLSRVTVVG